MNNSKQFGRIRTQIIDRQTGQVTKSQPWRDNLVMDSCLNSFAGGNQGFAVCFAQCKIGSGTFPNTYASGAITFTQAATAVVASGTFFTSAMIGGILKYGTGTSGVEQYITAVADATHATVSSSATVAATAGTVWQVQQTALQTLLYSSTTYDTGSGNCSTTYGSSTLTLLRTFIFPTQASPYSVNEIGYANTSQTGATINGRVVLSSTDVVSPTEYYRVQIELVINVAPSSPTAIANVGTGIDTSGFVMNQVWDCSVVDSNGSSVKSTTDSYNCCIMDLASSIRNYLPTVGFQIGLIANNSTIQTSNASASGANSYQVDTLTFSNSGNPVGVGTATASFSFSDTGQTMTNFTFGASNGAAIHCSFNHVLNTPFVLNNGTNAGNFTFTVVFSRTLAN